MAIAPDNLPLRAMLQNIGAAQVDQRSSRVSALLVFLAIFVAMGLVYIVLTRSAPPSAIDNSACEGNCFSATGNYF